MLGTFFFLGGGSELFAKETTSDIFSRQSPSLASAHCAECVSACLFIPLDCPNTPEAVDSVISKEKNEMKRVFSLKVTFDLSFPYT